MKKSREDTRIVFMGTPEFSVASLNILVENGFNIAGIVTAPDKPAGRGLQLQQSAVKKYAVAHDLPVLQPVKLKDPAFLTDLTSLHADLQVVVAFRMLPEIVWNQPSLGTINLHASLLPQYRGAAPINWAIIQGETETGITTFRLQHEIDTGSIIYQERISIREDETAGELHDEMKETGAKLVLKTVDAILENNYPLRPQNELLPPGSIIKSAPKIFKEDCRIVWENEVNIIYNLIRGLSPYPAAWTNIGGKIFKIFRAEKEQLPHNEQPGHVDTDGKTFLRFAAADGWIHALEVQLEGKKRMPVTDFLKGYHHR